MILTKPLALNKTLEAPNDQKIRVFSESSAGTSKTKANAARYISPNDMRAEWKIELWLPKFISFFYPPQPDPVRSEVARPYNLGTNQASKHGPEFCPRCWRPCIHQEGKREGGRERTPRLQGQQPLVSASLCHFPSHFRQRYLAKFGDGITNVFFEQCCYWPCGI